MSSGKFFLHGMYHSPLWVTHYVVQSLNSVAFAYILRNLQTIKLGSALEGNLLGQHRGQIRQAIWKRNKLCDLDVAFLCRPTTATFTQFKPHHYDIVILPSWSLSLSLMTCLDPGLLFYHFTLGPPPCTFAAMGHNGCQTLVTFGTARRGLSTSHRCTHPPTKCQCNKHHSSCYYSAQRYCKTLNVHVPFISRAKQNGEIKDREYRYYPHQL